MARVESGHETHFGLGPSLALSAICGVLYFILARFPLLFLPAPSHIAAYWPASGILIGSLLVTPPSRWAWILIGIAPANFLANFLTGKTLWVCLGFLISDIGVHTLVTWIVVYSWKTKIRFSTLADFGMFALIIAALGSALSALGGAAAAQTGVAEGSFPTLWRIWWLSDFLGILSVAPVILAWFGADERQEPGFSGRSLLEWPLLLGGLLAFSLLMFGHETERGEGFLMFPFLLFPPVVLLAFRLGLRGVSLGGMMISLIAFWGTLEGKGPFTLLIGDIPDRVLLLQGFLSILILSGLGIVAAITERKRARKALEESERLYRNAIEIIGAVPYYDLYEPHRYVSIGEGIEALTGYAPEEFTSEVLQEITREVVPLGQIEGLSHLEAVAKARGQEGVSWRADYRIRARDGSEKWIADAAVQIRDGDGRAIGSLGILEDITERKVAERTLRESERLYRNAIEVAGAVPYYENYTEAHRYDFLGEGIEALTGIPRDEFSQDVLDELTLEIIPHGSLEDMPVEEAIELARVQEGVSWQADYHLRLRNGSEKWLSNSAVQVRDREGRVIGSLGILLDITERRLAEETLRESERLYRTAIEGAGAVPYHRSHIEDKYRFLGKGIEFLTGFSSEELTPSLFGSLILEHDFQGALSGLETAEAVRRMQNERGTHWRCDIRIKARNGEERWLADASVQVTNERGEIVASLGSLQDITERKRAEEALRRSEHLYRSAIQAAGAVPYFRDKRTNLYEFLGDRIGELVGIPPDEFDGATFEEMIEETLLLDNLKGLSVEDAVEKVERELDTRWRADYRIRRTDGQVRWLSDASIQVRNEQGEVVGSLGILTDTTEARRAEQELREALSRFEAIIDNTPHVAIQGFDREGVVMHWNNASEIFYGCPSADALGRRIQDVLNMDEERAEFEQVLKEICETGRAVPPREWNLTGRDGKEMCVYSTMFPISSSGQVIEVFCMDVDITAKKRAEEERLRLEAQIHHTQKLESLGVLAGGIAHDFNNLLMGVLGNASLALLELSPESPARESVAQIETAALRAADLAKQMLAYSGKGKFVVQRINLSKLVEEMSHLLEVSITKKAVLRYHFAENLPAVEADATQVRQIILNLITNASDALGTKSGIITINTGVMDADSNYLSSTYLDDELPSGHYVYVEVTDTGCGMDEETRSRIFDPFFTTKFTGRGLGLAAVLGIVRGHHGAIKVYSQLGIGTTFKVLFPATYQEPEEFLPSVSPKKEVWRATGTILVVDDEETVRVVSKRMLEAFGLTVLCAKDGAEGVEIFRDHAGEVSVVLLDMTMPRMSGEEAYREMRRIRADVRVILTSGYNEQEAISRFAGKRLAGFIQKPFTHASLLDKVREVLETGA